MRRLFNFFSLTAAIAIAGSSVSFACTQEEFSLFDHQTYTARAASYQGELLKAESALASLKSIEPTMPEADTEYNRAGHFLTMGTFFQTKSAYDSSLSQLQSKISCYGTLAAQFNKLGAYQDLITQQFQGGFASELDRAVLVYKWRTTLADRAQKLSNSNEGVVKNKFPQLYRALSNMGFPAEYSDIGRYSYQIQQQYGRTFNSYEALGELSYQWDKLFNEKIAGLKTQGKGALVALYQDLSRQVNLAQFAATIEPVRQ